MSSGEVHCLVNGHWSDSIPASDRGLAYGHGLFESMRLNGGQIPLLDFHLQRLETGAARLSLPFSLSRCRDYLNTLLHRCTADGVVKLILTAGSGGRGYRADSSVEPLYILQCFPLPDYPSTWSQTGVSVTICEHRLPIAPRLAGLKHLNRLDQVLARMEWQDEYQEGLMLDREGRVIEGTMTNLFCFRDGSWLTPDLSRCGVSGVLRQYLKDELLPALGIQVSETMICLEELGTMEELFLCNSVAGIWPVESVKDSGCWQVGKRTEAISRALQQEMPCYG
ncbi:MAG: aminodeoxychorismate lyase [Gammaproteobacteria bacterium]|nr:MAG: aminodeoxychorismate lyase [Gammaproteobacteria bacterium]